MKKLIWIITGILALAPALSGEEFIYSVKQKKENREETYTVRREGENLAVTYENGKYVSRSLSGPDGMGIHAHFFFPERELDISAEKKGDTVTVYGINEGREILKTFTPSLPWCTTYLLLPWFIKSDLPVMDFCVFIPVYSKLFDMKAEKEAEEILIIMGQETRTVKVKVTISGFLGAFWNSYYWYRLSDGLYVKSEENRVGSGKIRTELIRVEP